MENKKAIAWVRCSTTKQHTTDEQLNAIVELAAKDGYTADDLITIGREGASAIKVDSAYKEDLDKMYSLMNSGEVDTVYAWAVDRVGRDTKENAFFKYKLLDCHINFKTVEGVNMEAGEDGIATILLDLKQRIAEDEMKKKAARFQLGKDRNKKLGRYNGGNVCYGYRVNDGGYFEIDEETANIVRRIYNLYINSNHTSTTIGRLLYNEGVIERKSERSRSRWVVEVLRNKTYTGVHPYQRVIADEDFDKAQTKMDENKSMPRHTHNTCTNYAHGLLRVKDAIAKKGYYQMTIKRCDAQYIEPNSHNYISADIADSLLLHAANKYVNNYSQKDADEKVAEIQERIQELSAQNMVLGKRVKAIEGKLERLEVSYIEGNIGEEKRNMMRNQYKAERATILEQIDELAQQIINLTDRGTMIIDERIDNLYHLTDLQRKEEINKIIEYCEVEKVSNGTYNILIHYKLNGVEVYQINSKKHKYYLNKDGQMEELDIKMLGRYQRRPRA